MVQMKDPLVRLRVKNAVFWFSVTIYACPSVYKDVFKLVLLEDPLVRLNIKMQLKSITVK